MRAAVAAILVAGCASDAAPIDLNGLYRIASYSANANGCEEMPSVPRLPSFDLLEDWRGQWTVRLCDADGTSCDEERPGLQRKGDELELVQSWATHGDDPANNRITCVLGYERYRVVRVAPAIGRDPEVVRYEVIQHRLETGDWSSACTAETAVMVVGDGNCSYSQIFTGELVER